MKILRLVQTALIGGLGGLLGWICLQFFLFAQLKVGTFPFIDQYIYEGIFVSLGIGILLYSKEAILSHNFSILLKNIWIGAYLGVISGFLGFLIGQFLLSHSMNIPLFWIRIVSWTLVGFCLGFLFSLKTSMHSNKVSLIVGATLGGGLGGSIFEVCQLLQNEYLANLVGLIIIGMILSISMFITKIWLIKAYIRVLTGENEGKIYLLDKNIFTLGYLPQNDIILRGYSEVCQTHAHLSKENGNFQIKNVCPGGQVFINYRFVDQQDMKNGDIIKLGTALLQFCEVL